MPVPYPPLQTGIPEQDIELIFSYLNELAMFIANGEPDQGWSVSGTTSDKVLASGDTLANTINVLATLIQTLTLKRILTS